MRKTNSVLKRCIYHYQASANHSRSLKLGIIEDVYVANKIISGYSQCGLLDVAHQLFDKMPQRDIVSWNAIIAGYVNSGNSHASGVLFNDMRRHGFSVDGYTFGSLLKGIASNGDLQSGKQLHGMIFKTGSQLDVVIGSALLVMYSKCGRIDDAHMVFKRMPMRNSVSWNTMIAGYVEQADFEAALQLLVSMEKGGINIEDGTVAPFLTLLSDPDFFKLTMQLHGKIIKIGLISNNVVCNAVLTSYSECGCLENAENVFCGAFDIHDLVTWNSMLAAYLLHQEESLALKLYLKMEDCGFEPDIYTYTSILTACFGDAYQVLGKCFHCIIVKKGVESSTAISNALIAMYLKMRGKSTGDALRLFESIDQKDAVSWNSVVTGLAQFGFSEDAIKFFGNMRSCDVGIDHYSFSAVLRSSADLAALQLGRQLHALAFKSGLQSNEHVASSLILMYCKCGLLNNARKSFEEIPKDSPMTWNFLIFGYAQHGQGKAAFELFCQMTESNVKPDHITFVAVLTACSHMGWVGEGQLILKIMESDYGIPLRMEHYACAIDLFGRAGLMDEAKALVKSMPFEPDATVWKTLLGACRNCGDVELASQVASHLFEIDPEEHCTYVILSDMYGRLKRWEEKANLTRLMRERGVKKVPGWSWIEINNEAHAFNAEDSFHPDSIEIYDILDRLMEEIRMLKEASKIEDANKGSVVIDGCLC